MARPSLIENSAAVSHEIAKMPLASTLYPRPEQSRQLRAVLSIAMENRAGFGIVRVGLSHGSRIPVGDLPDP